MRKGKVTGEERLASRYWDLLDFYPRWYREERGPELVGTLLDGARPGQVRPSWREARALALEGLRVRAGTGGHRSRRETLARGVQWGLLILLASTLLSRGSDVLGARAYDDVRPVTVGWSVLFGLFGLALVVPFGLLALGRVRLALPFVVVAGAVEMVGFPWLHRTGWAEPPPSFPLGWPQILPVYLNPGTAVVLVAGTLLLIRLRPPPIGRRGVVAAALLAALFTAPLWADVGSVLPDGVGLAIAPVVALAILLGYFGVMAYVVVDAHPAVAVTTLLSLLVVDLVVSALQFGFGDYGLRPDSLVQPLVLIPPVGVAAWLGLRRQARAAVPDMTA